MPSWPSMVVGEAVRQSVVKLFVSYASHPVSQPCHPVEHAVLGQSCALASDLLVFSVSSLGPLLVGIVRSHMGHSVGQRVPNGPRMMFPQTMQKHAANWGGTPLRPPSRHPPLAVYTAPAARPPFHTFVLPIVRFRFQFPRSTLPLSLLSSYTRYLC